MRLRLSKWNLLLTLVFVLEGSKHQDHPIAALPVVLLCKLLQSKNVKNVSSSYSASLLLTLCDELMTTGRDSNPTSFQEYFHCQGR